MIIERILLVMIQRHEICTIVGLSPQGKEVCSRSCQTMDLKECETKPGIRFRHKNTQCSVVNTELKSAKGTSVNGYKYTKIYIQLRIAFQGL